MSFEKDIHIIAEAGTNHNGELKKAKNLVDIAVRAQTDSVKFQIIYPEGLYLPGKYEYGHYDIEEVIKIRRDGMLSDDEYSELAEYSNSKNMAMSASIFDVRGLDLLTKFNPLYIKTASCDLNNIRLLKKIAERGFKMVISTGMSTLSDIDFTLNELNKINFTNYVLLHCVSVYPAYLKDTNLNFLETLKNEFNCEIGFSDHTGDSIAASVALAKGATWFEKHFTEDRTQKGFDHAYALEAEELMEYVTNLKDTYHSLNEKKEKINDNEMYTRKRARRSLYASRKISAGDIINEDDVLIVRPEAEMDANEVYQIIGKKVKRTIYKHEPFSLKMVE